MRWTVPLLSVHLLLSGCASSPPPTAPSYADRGVDRPSLVFDAPHLADAAPPGAMPWWADRNDLERSTFAGYRTPTFTSQTTYTVDRQRIVNGRVLDDVRTTTYRVQRVEAVR